MIYPEWNVHRMLERIKALETRCMLLEEAMDKLDPTFIEPDKLDSDDDRLDGLKLSKNVTLWELK